MRLVLAQKVSLGSIERTRLRGSALRAGRGASDSTIRLYARDAAHLMAAPGDDPEQAPEMLHVVMNAIQYACSDNDQPEQPRDVRLIDRKPRGRA